MTYTHHRMIFLAPTDIVFVASKIFWLLRHPFMSLGATFLVRANRNQSSVYPVSREGNSVPRVVALVVVAPIWVFWRNANHHRHIKTHSGAIRCYSLSQEGAEQALELTRFFKPSRDITSTKSGVWISSVYFVVNSRIKPRTLSCLSNRALSLECG